MSLPISGKAHQAGGGADFVWFVHGSWQEVVIRGARASGLPEEWLEALRRQRPAPGAERR